MANLNLSQFGENTSVSDADYTFVWDSAASISKKVSRNSWLNSGELTSSAPVTISQTWNAGSNVMTALKVVATDTASGPTSNLLELWAGSTPELKFYVAKSGSLSFRAGANFGSISTDGTGRVLLNSSSSAGARVSGDFHIGSNDVILVRDSASGNTLALRNGTSAQTFNVYGTYTSGSVYERMFMRYNGTDLAFQVGAETLGATARPLQLWTGGASRLHITTAGNVGIGTTAPTAPLEIRGTAVASTRESLLKCTMSDGGNDAFHVFNGTSLDGRFSPSFSGSTFSSNQGTLSFSSQTDASNDAGTIPLMLFSGRITNSQTDPNNGTLSTVTTRPLFSWQNLTAVHMLMAANGNLGIGTTSPTSKLQVSAGDVEVDTIAKGVILKSPDGTRYRVTVANGGTLSVAAV